VIKNKTKKDLMVSGSRGQQLYEKVRAVEVEMEGLPVTGRGQQIK
jgi:hypothetical protein